MAGYFFGDIAFGAELLFSIITVIFCFLIWLRTKESYELTKYEGIKHFRDAFLFLGLSYALRFFLSLTFFSRMAFDLLLPMAVMPLLILPLGYFSTIVIFYLILGSVWKRIKNNNFVILSHGIAIILSVVAFITRSHLTLLYLQCALLVFVIILNFIILGKKTKISLTKVLYIVVAALWLVSLLVTDPGQPLPFGIKFFFQTVSLAVLAFIYYKISKWVK